MIDINRRHKPSYLKILFHSTKMVGQDFCQHQAIEKRKSRLVELQLDEVKV
jgi:hypothetical protein